MQAFIADLAAVVKEVFTGEALTELKSGKSSEESSINFQETMQSRFIALFVGFAGLAAVLAIVGTSRCAVPPCAHL